MRVSRQESVSSYTWFTASYYETFNKITFVMNVKYVRDVVLLSLLLGVAFSDKTTGCKFNILLVVFS